MKKLLSNALLVIALLSLAVNHGWIGGGGIFPSPSGKHFVILHESEQDTPALTAEFTAIRTGDNAKFFKGKGYALEILDDDPQDQDGNPVPLVAKLNAEGVIPPSIFSLDTSDGVLSKAPLPAGVPAIMDFVKQHGG